ncbi:MAG: decaprenyl-phosphate phosphoribosyltransferase [bacterium]|nr:decaprenyl-phosphate phosphoribosyltransferase [bacterium]
MLKDYIQLLRPHQYAKNFFIFLPLFFSLKFHNKYLLANTIFAFFTYCLAASSIYIFNDYYDIEEDKKHPTKKNRPLVSGKIPKASAIHLMLILLVYSLIIAYFISIKIFLLILFYISLNIWYTIRLRHVPVIDVFSISIGFIIRLFVGSEASDVSVSLWIVIMTFLLALFLAFAKRRDDILLFLKDKTKTRKVISKYNLEFVNISMTLMAAVIIVAYTMYSITPEVIEKIKSEYLYLTVIWVTLGILRYLQITFVYEESGAPTRILLKDRFLQLILFCWIATFWILIYGWDVLVYLFSL